MCRHAPPAWRKGYRKGKRHFALTHEHPLTRFTYLAICAKSATNSIYWRIFSHFSVEAGISMNVYANGVTGGGSPHLLCYTIIIEFNGRSKQGARSFWGTKFCAPTIRYFPGHNANFRDSRECISWLRINLDRNGWCGHKMNAASRMQDHFHGNI